MNRAYHAHSSTIPYLEKVRSHSEPYNTMVLGKEIVVFPDVMSPLYDKSSEFFVRNMPNQNGRSLLEIGCGSGIVSLFAQLQGTRSVDAIDINVSALENTKTNLAAYGATEAKVYRSDVFSSVRGLFDTIAFNAPYHGSIPRDMLEYGVSDPGYRALQIFFQHARFHLNDNGQVLLGFSDTGDVELLHELIVKHFFTLCSRFEEDLGGWKAYLYILEPVRFKNASQKFIYDDDLFWFHKYQHEVKTGAVLKVGYGLGFASSFCKLFNQQTTSIDIAVSNDSLNKHDLVVYNGVHLPFLDKQFDSVIVAYTLHHAEEPERLLKEIVRVTKNKIIVIEETHTGVISKIDSIYHCWRVNKSAYQNVKIQWNSYFSQQNIRLLFQDLGLKIELLEQMPRRSYSVEMFVLNIA